MAGFLTANPDGHRHDWNEQRRLGLDLGILYAHGVRQLKIPGNLLEETNSPSMRFIDGDNVSCSQLTAAFDSAEVELEIEMTSNLGCNMTRDLGCPYCHGGGEDNSMGLMIMLVVTAVWTGSCQGRNMCYCPPRSHLFKASVPATADRESQARGSESGMTLLGSFPSSLGLEF
jgi:hypothetical protein